MQKVASFQTKARTIDHLGRGQIADAPTAVSELWKNAYDAYARNVELHVYEGEVPVTAVIDNGCGMSAQEFLDYWLVVGTESKAAAVNDKSSMFGLEYRENQGEKGIGRLSTAFLAPVTLVVTKKVDTNFTAALIDWRFFENPYLNITDIEFPIIEFDDLKDLQFLVPEMFETLKSNLVWDLSSQDTRDVRLAGAWSSFSELEKDQKKEIDTYTAISEFNHDDLITPFHLHAWRKIMDAADEEELHGTALFGIAPYRELSSLVLRDHEDEDAKAVGDNLRYTLTGFSDPYSSDINNFAYAVQVHYRGKAPHTILDSDSFFGMDDFKALEHWVYGEFDGKGNFHCEVQAFGKYRGKKEFPAIGVRKLQKSDHVGPFQFCIGSFEASLGGTRSTHPTEEWELIQAKSDLYGGILVYRDNLRVMPYGRPGSDLFNIEFRRSKNAGDFFFSHRKSFGRMAFTRTGNPNLKDKAGREGLVDNRARREMIRLVEGVLVDVAMQFFGRRSVVRQQELPEIQKRNKLQIAAAERARKRRKRNFAKVLNDNFPVMLECRESIEDQSEALSNAITRKDQYDLSLIRTEIDRLDAFKEQLMLPPLPAKLGKNEAQYRDYRDAYLEFCVILSELKKRISQCEAEGLFGDPKDVAIYKFKSNESKLSKQVSKSLGLITGHLKALTATWDEEANNDRKLYGKSAVNYIDLLKDREGLPRILDMLDNKYNELREDFEIKYSGAFNSLDQIVNGVDIEGAFLLADQERVSLEQKVEQLNAVAQLGISVEIIGHELQDLEAQVSKYMHKLPVKVRQLTSYKLAYEAHRALIDRLRFLTPMKITAYRSRVYISGAEISSYLENFFDRILKDNRINFSATPAFKDIKIKDLPSRIYPTFINLVNNAIYWVQRGDERKVVLDFVDGKVVVADSGPGVDPDDQPRLFELFFTRRSNGRGVGLYLCRQNLAVAHHKIRYATTGDPKVCDGANFIIEFRGVENAD